MPRFTGQNKKRIDPRYFLKEEKSEDDEFTYGRFKDLPGYQDEANPSKWKKNVKEYDDYDPPTEAEFAQDEADEERIQLYLSVLLPRAKEFMLMLADQKQPAYKDAYNAEELVGELAAAAGQPIDLLEEILRALGEDPEEILYNASTEGEY